MCPDIHVGTEKLCTFFRTILVIFLYSKRPHDNNNNCFVTDSPCSETLDVWDPVSALRQIRRCQLNFVEIFKKYISLTAKIQSQKQIQEASTKRKTFHNEFPKNRKSCRSTKNFGQTLLSTNAFFKTNCNWIG